MEADCGGVDHGAVAADGALALEQFIDTAGSWPVAAQTGLLSLLHLTACVAVYLAVGVLACTVLKTRPSAARVVTRISGAVMIAIGAFLLVERLTG